MDLWWLSAALNGLIALTYAAVSAAILVPLTRLGQFRSNRLGTATGAIFLTCAIGHSLHAVHPVLSYLELTGSYLEVPGAEDLVPGGALAWHDVFRDWHDVFWDGLTAVVGIYYWTLRRSYMHLVRGPAMFEDLATRQRLTELEAATKLHAVREQAAAELERSERRFRLAFEHAPIGITLVSLDGQSPGRVLRANSAFCSLLGRTQAEVAEGNVLRFIVPEDREAAETRLAQMAAGEITEYTACRRYRNADGRVIWTTLTAAVVEDDAGTPLYLVEQLEDITARRAAEQVLTRQALHDGLTGLPNRLLLLDRIEHALTRAQRQGSHVALFFLDVDGFKLINDALGHHAGDHLLTELARRLSAQVRDDDTVARLGGDEFVILCEDISDLTAAQQAAERILSAANGLYDIEGEVVPAKASMGVALSGPDSTPTALLRDADTAMYRAKNLGKARIAVYDDSLRAGIDRRLQLEKELRAGIHTGQLRVLFQPVIDLDSGHQVAVEALVRWEHPTRGLLTPHEFLDVAETTGLIIPLGQWVVREACHIISRWMKEDLDTAPGRFTINLSASEINRPGIVEDIARALTEAELSPRMLCVEITESSLLDANSTNIATVEQLRELGVGIALDDFGTGYSSLTNLKRFPVDVVKIDRSFVAGLGTDAEDTAIVGAVIGLAKALGLTTIAEGVEEQHQGEHLRRLGCTYAQGFFYSEPASVDQLRNDLAARSFAQAEGHART